MKFKALAIALLMVSAVLGVSGKKQRNLWWQRDISLFPEKHKVRIALHGVIT